MKKFENYCFGTFTEIYWNYLIICSQKLATPGEQEFTLFISVPATVLCCLQIEGPDVLPYSLHQNL